jgi:Zn-finger nucleic acid-binding protein
MFIKKKKLLCPKCNSPMEKVTYQDIEIDRCTNCKGIWLDVFEKDRLKAKNGSDAVDVGDKKAGEEYNKKEKVNCPRCLIPMVSKVLIEQKHIRYETCTSCYGVFFDAGEFTDFKEENFLDFIKGIITKK